jgi:hypothetical protein
MMRKRPLLLALLLLAAAQPVAAGPFAIRCTGSAEFRDKISGERTTRRPELPAQIYVVDEGNRRVQRALVPRQEFEDVCGRGTEQDVRDFSPGLIMVRTLSSDRMCDFRVNRATGEAEYFSHQDLPAGDYNQMEWRMTCSPTQIPVFDRSRNRF